MNFLDTTVKKDKEGNVSTDLYQKPTDTHPYLHWTSAHPPHLKHSIPYSQALRLRRICSHSETLKNRIEEYSIYFLACGYKQNTVLNEMQKVLTMTQEDCLQIKARETVNRTPLVTTFSPHTPFIAEIANRNWDFLKSKERLASIFKDPPLIAYRRPKNLRDKLVFAKFTQLGRTDNQETGCKPCGKPKCSWCRVMKETTTFHGTRNNARLYKIQHKLDCQSSWVIYLIQCNQCKLPYIGKSEYI